MLKKHKTHIYSCIIWSHTIYRKTKHVFCAQDISKIRLKYIHCIYTITLTLDSMYNTLHKTIQSISKHLDNNIKQRYLVWLSKGWCTWEAKANELGWINCAIGRESFILGSILENLLGLNLFQKYFSFTNWHYRFLQDHKNFNIWICVV